MLVFSDDTNNHPQNDRHTSTNYTSKHWVKDANVKSDTRHQQASVSMSQRAHNRFVSLLPPRDGKEHDRITKQLEFNITTSSVKLILLAGSHSIASARTRLKSEHCNVVSCVFTRDYSRLYEADAVLVTGMTLPLSVRPKRRRRRQVSHDRPDRRRLTYVAIVELHSALARTEDACDVVTRQRRDIISDNVQCCRANAQIQASSHGAGMGYTCTSPPPRI